MTSHLDTGTRSAGDRARARAYYRDFVPAIGGYTVVMLAVLAWGGLDGGASSRFVWALLPLLPALLVVRAVVRHLRRIDDYQQTLLLRGLSVGFAVAMASAITLGLLEAGGLQVEGAGWLVYGAGMAGWGGAALGGCR